MDCQSNLSKKEHFCKSGCLCVCLRLSPLQAFEVTSHSDSPKRAGKNSHLGSRCKEETQFWGHLLCSGSRGSYEIREPDGSGREEGSRGRRCRAGSRGAAPVWEARPSAASGFPDAAQTCDCLNGVPAWDPGPEPPWLACQSWRRAEGGRQAECPPSHRDVLPHSPVFGFHGVWARSSSTHSPSRRGGDSWRGDGVRTGRTAAGEGATCARGRLEKGRRAHGQPGGWRGGGVRTGTTTAGEGAGCARAGPRLERGRHAHGGGWRRGGVRTGTREAGEGAACARAPGRLERGRRAHGHPGGWRGTRESRLRQLNGNRSGQHRS